MRSPARASIIRPMSERGLHTDRRRPLRNVGRGLGRGRPRRAGGTAREARGVPRLPRGDDRPRLRADPGGNARPMNSGWLYRGTPGHPLHPPLTDATIGIYTFATIAAVLSKVGDRRAEGRAGLGARADRRAVIVALPTALTGFADWIRIARGTPLFKTATAHMIAMLVATAFFLIVDRRRLQRRHRRRAHRRCLHPHARRVRRALRRRLARRRDRLQHGMRVLNLVEEPASTGCSPVPTQKKKRSGEGASRSDEAEACSSAPFGWRRRRCAGGSPSLKRTIDGIEAIP